MMESLELDLMGLDPADWIIIDCANTCELCGREFPDEWLYWDHVDDWHTEEEWNEFYEELMGWLNPLTGESPPVNVNPMTPMRPTISTRVGLLTSPRET
jgi:hypothetical protein